MAVTRALKKGEKTRVRPASRAAGMQLSNLWPHGDDGSWYRYLFEVLVSAQRLVPYKAHFVETLRVFGSADFDFLPPSCKGQDHPSLADEGGVDPAGGTGFGLADWKAWVHGCVCVRVRAPAAVEASTTMCGRYVA